MPTTPDSLLLKKHDIRNMSPAKYRYYAIHLNLSWQLEIRNIIIVKSIKIGLQLSCVK